MFINLNQNKNNGMIGNNVHVSTGTKQSAEQLKQDKQDKVAMERTQSGSIKATDLTLVKDSAVIKKRNAHKEAMKKLGDVFSSHLKTDNEITTHTDRMAELEEDAKNAQAELDKLNESKSELQKEYEGRMDSPEYIQKVLEIDKATQEFSSRLEVAKSEKVGHSKAIEGIHQALLKADPMVGAQKAADKIMDAANKDIIGDLVADAKDAIEEKIEEEVEKAQEKKEEKQEEEKKQVEREKQQQDSLTSATDTIQTADSTQNKIENEIKNLIKNQQLIEEDLKGLEIDQLL